MTTRHLLTFWAFAFYLQGLYINHHVIFTTNKMRVRGIVVTFSDLKPIFIVMEAVFCCHGRIV